MFCDPFRLRERACCTSFNEAFSVFALTIMKLPLRKTFFAIGLLVTGAMPAGVSARIDVGVARSVDTTDAERKIVLDLWVDYLESDPRAMWQSQEWDEEKRRFWLDFDLTAPFVYRSDAGGNSRDFRATVLAVEREGERYSIRTLYYAVGGDSVDTGRDPWAIVRVFAQRVGGQWKLRNALGVLTERWNRPAIGKVTFVLPPGHHFDTRLARNAVAFCDSVSELFPFLDWDPFDFYITNRREDVDRIIGLDYLSDGYPTWRALRSQDILITAKGSEWAPHALVRMMVSGPGISPHAIIESGFPGWIGGWGGLSFGENMSRIAAGLASGELASFQRYVDEAGEPGRPETVFAGAVVCDMVFAASGAVGIQTLLQAGRGDRELEQAIQESTGMDPDGFERAWRRYVLDFEN